MSSDNPDLTSILATLSAFSNQVQTNIPPPSSSTATATPSNNDSGQESEYEPRGPTPQSQPQPQPQTQPRPQPPNTKQTSSSSSITTWPPALKHVMRTVAQNEEIQTRIRFLIQRQHDHERQWWKGREALLVKQASRKEKKRELDNVLRSVGAPVDEKDVSTAEEDLTEIRTYDAKVHKASTQMADAMLNELKALDVPFFTISKDLVIKPKQEGEHDSHPPDHPSESDKQGLLSVDDLVAFRRRMLELLQDLCRE
ncbi:hypothetical protein BDV18DRAFT_10834 [Aspergillus unguis]